MSLHAKLARVASVCLRRGHPSLFKRLTHVSLLLARPDRKDTDKLLSDSLLDERKNEPPIEVVDADNDGKLEPPLSSTEDEADDEDVEAYFPMGALPYKERRKGPHPKDVKPGKPDWWNPR